MKKRENVVLYGGGGGAVEIARYINDQNQSDVGSAAAIVTDVIDEGEGRDADLSSIVSTKVHFHNSVDSVEDIANKKCIVTLGNSPIRHEIYLSLGKKCGGFYTVIHPSALVSAQASVGEGSIISPYTLLGTYSELGPNTFVNIRVTVGHDAVIGESSILSPHCAISGAVQCGRCVYFGAGVVVNPGIRIGSFSKLSSGAIVASDVDEGCIAYGNPARATRVFNPENGHSLFQPK